MIAEIGHFSLLLAFLLAIVQGIVPLWGASRGDARMMAVARPAAIGQLVFVAAAFGCLTAAFVASDFSVAIVHQYSHTLKPMLYKVSGVWGNHEGSMLLWVLILALFGAAVAAFGNNLPQTLKARVLSVQGLIAIGFLAFIVFTSNPFLRLDPVPLEGRGLNPLLQDPGLAFHPPFLYLGYVGFSMAFSFAVAALIEGRVDPAWARWVRPWTLVAWCALTLGIAMGSWWAYYELGWGGWWFWDPVENASFMPWLAGTALLHSAIVVEKRDTLKSWTILLAIIAFALSLLGTFLVRSGVTVSVHTFATDPARGVFILALLVLVVGGSLALYAVRAPRLQGGGLFAPVSREGGLVLNNLLISSACALVFIGTLSPIINDAFKLPPFSVGPQFFNLTFPVIMLPALVALVFGSMLAWKRGSIRPLLRRLTPALALAIVAFAATLWDKGVAHWLAGIGMAVATWVVAGTATEFATRIGAGRIAASESVSRVARLPRSYWGMAIAHAGLGVVVAGITASSAWRTESIQMMRPGDTVEVAGYSFAFEGAENIAGPNYSAVRGNFAVTRGGKAVATLTPERRSYPAERSSTTEAAIHTTWLADLYAVLGEPGDGGAWATRIYHNPLVPWIWAGAVLITLGGLVSLTDRRLRVGAPKRARRQADGGAGPEPARA